MELIERYTDSALARLPLFEGLTPDELQLARTVMKRKLVPAGQVLMHENQVGDSVYFLAYGVARLCTQRSGTDVIVGLRAPGELLGEIGILDGKPRLVTIITQTPCTLFAVSGDDFLNVLCEIKPFAINMQRLLAKHVRRLTAQVEAMATLSVQGRLARQICLLADEYGCPVHNEEFFSGVEIPFRLTQADLSHMIGATRVQVNQVYCQWKKRNIIASRHNHLVVIDDLALRALIV